MVIVALGTGKSMKATTLYSDFAKLLVEVQKETNTQIPFIMLEVLDPVIAVPTMVLLQKYFLR